MSKELEMALLRKALKEVLRHRALKYLDSGRALCTWCGSSIGGLGASDAVNQMIHADTCIFAILNQEAQCPTD